MHIPYELARSHYLPVASALPKAEEVKCRVDRKDMPKQSSGHFCLNPTQGLSLLIGMDSTQYIRALEAIFVSQVGPVQVLLTELVIMTGTKALRCHGMQLWNT
jgi:hypothetical protein